ncbi:hypothetical protein BDW02DRAFT_575307 [Decorospora gaudefroyi]|uniref:F-box domain-containing protein n=1 Tax=Decorospora gaudefroyi TaxID=184978 RepID=A0A6A5KMC9_9PLEO|nr:hypothetical protein BDW02DRAFT_575307 [Decorospora gaudefroyi]
MAQPNTAIPAPGTKVPQTSPLLRMPREMLMWIALCVDGDNKSTDLLHLALTHSKLRRLASESLVRNPILPIHTIPRYMETLSAHSGWARQITVLTIKDDKRSNKKPLEPSTSTLDACRELIKAVWRNEHENPEKMLILFDEELKSTDFWYFLLFGVLRNLAELSLKVTPDYISPTQRSLYSGPKLGGGPKRGSRKLVAFRCWVQRRFSERLERLSVTATLPHDVEQDNFPYLGIYHFKNIRSLTVTCDILFKPTPTWSPYLHFGHLPLQNVLPDKLEKLQIFCNHKICPWKFLDEMNRAFELGQFSGIKRIQLFFDLPRRSLARDIVCPTEPARTSKIYIDEIKIFELLEKLSLVEHVSVQTLFPKPGTLEQPRLDSSSYQEGCLVREIRSDEILGSISPGGILRVQAHAAKETKWAPIYENPPRGVRR